jgi:Ca2+-binding RTX toxin-like protein
MRALSIPTTTLTGTPGDEQLAGTVGDDFIFALAGDDTVLGLGGNDYLAGQAGDDLLNGGSGDDTLVGGQGSDTLTGGSGDDLIQAGDPARDVIDGGSGHDVLSFALASNAIRFNGVQILHIQGVEELVGSDFDDRIDAIDQINKINGGGGDDVLSGGSDAMVFTLIGGAGDDHITGSDRALVLGGAGKDVLTGRIGTVDGGAGSDVLIAPDHIQETFRFSESARHGRDLIQGMQDGAVIIDLSPIDADTTQAGDQAFTLVSGFSHHAGEAWLHVVGSETWLQLDADGDAVADVTVRMDGFHTGFTNFVL